MTQGMTARVSHISEFFNQWAPQSIKLSYDNVGLLVGNPEQEVTNVLTCLDVTEEVVDEAVARKCDLIVSHHPLIFKGIKHIRPNSLEGAILYKLIQNNISVIAAHTNLDAAYGGVSYVTAKRIGLQHIHFLDDSYSTARFLTMTLPVNAAQFIRDHMRKMGIKHIEIFDYTHIDGDSKVVKLEAELDSWQVSEVKKIVFDTLPEKNTRFQVFSLDESSDSIGMGIIGEFEQAMNGKEFLNQISETLSVKAIRYAGYSEKVKKVAVCGGAGVSLTSLARAKGADAFVTADIKYHDYFIERGPFMLVDVGHYESEVPVVDVMRDELKRRFKDLEVLSTRIKTSPMRVHINDIQEKNNPE